MVRSELKAIMVVASTALIPWIAQADSPDAPGSSSYLAGDKIKEGQLPSGYNKAASYDCLDPWKLFLTGDYIYWTWQQELMQVGTFMTPTAFGSSAFLNGEGEVVLQTPDYASGFQLGMGCDLRGMDDWNLYSEYTWYKNTNNLHTTTSGSELLAVSSRIIPYLEYASLGILVSEDLTTTARMTYNMVDLVLERPFYFGRKLTANFIVGLEALWISQEFTANGSELSFIEPDSQTSDLLSNASFSSYSKQKSWGLGPKFGINSSWLLGYGLKIIGTASLSALYTSYIKLITSTVGTISTFNLINLEMNQPGNYNTVNPIGTASLGLGWGSYFCNNSFHFDLLASYDFKVFWSQNVIDSLLNGNGSPGNMSLRGLNIQARFDF